MEGEDRAEDELADQIGRLGWGTAKEREAAARALGASGDARAIDPLLAVMNQHEDWGLVGAAARALGKLDEPGVDALISVVTESDRWRRFDTPFYNDRGRGLALSAPDPRESYDIVRTHAAEALAEAKAVRARNDVRARAVEVIVGVLVRHGRGPARDALSEALKKLGYTASAIERLEQEARSERRRSSDSAEPTAAGGGAAVHPPEQLHQEETHDVAQLLELLGKAFRQNDLKAADRIERSLKKAAPGDIDALTHGLSDDNPMVRDTVVEVLGDVGGVETLPVLREALDDRDDQLRVLATRAIERIMSRATQDVVQLLELLREAFRQDDRKAADKITRSLKKAAPGDVRAVTHGLSDDNPMVRWTIVEVMGDIGGVETLPVLREALNDPDEGVREAASVAIERIESRSVNPT